MAAMAQRGTSRRLFACFSERLLQATAMALLNLVPLLTFRVHSICKLISNCSARCYRDGLGVQPDDVACVALSREAIARGSALGKATLGISNFHISV